VDRAVDEHGDLRAEVDEVGAGLRGGNQLLWFVRKPAAFGYEQVDEATLEVRVAAALEEGGVVITPGSVFGRCCGGRKVEQEVADRSAVKDTVVALVAVAEQAAFDRLVWRWPLIRRLSELVLVACGRTRVGEMREDRRVAR
jgi:hypothetical protein